MGKPTVLLADDLPQMRKIVAELLESECDVVAAVENGQLAVEAVARLDPDIVVLDISMPVLNGFQAASRLRKLGCRTKVIMLTVHEDKVLMEAAYALGVVGYVLKNRLYADLVPAIQNALCGHYTRAAG